MDFSDAQIDRYARHLVLPEVGEDGQAKLLRSSVLVIADLQESPELALDFVFGDSSGLLGRSVSMASFVLEKLYLDEGISGSKKVNIKDNLILKLERI